MRASFSRATTQAWSCTHACTALLRLEQVQRDLEPDGHSATAACHKEVDIISRRLLDVLMAIRAATGLVGPDRYVFVERYIEKRHTASRRVPAGWKPELAPQQDKEVAKELRKELAAEKAGDKRGAEKEPEQAVAAASKRVLQQPIFKVEQRQNGHRH